MTALPLEKLCKCGHSQRDHLDHCFACPCVKFSVDPRTIPLTEHLENISVAIEGALEEINTYKGRCKKTLMPVWASGDDFNAYHTLLEMFEQVEILRGKLKTGKWKGRLSV